MPKIFTTLDKIKPAYDVTYKVVLFICKILLIVDILITTMSVIGRYVPFIPDPAWSEEVVLTCMSYMAVLSAALAIRRGAHIRMTAFDVYLPGRPLRACGKPCLLRRFRPRPLRRMRKGRDVCPPTDRNFSRAPGRRPAWPCRPIM